MAGRIRSIKPEVLEKFETIARVPPSSGWGFIFK